MGETPSRRIVHPDSMLYGASAIFAAGVAAFASIPQYREWGRLAVGPYVVGTAIAVVMGRMSVRARTWLAAAVFAGAAVLPLALEAAWRSAASPGAHAQSEVLITEEGAKALLDGRDPYAATYLHGSLAARPLGTKTHFPYLPGMLSFGLPRAADGRSPVADARVAFAAGTLLAFGLAWRRLRGSPAANLRAGQVLLALPTGALLFATGGDDLPVLALLLLALAQLADDRPIGAGVAAGLAAAMKQTAWLAIPFLVVGAGTNRRRVAATAAVPFLGIVVPFVLWDPGAFVEDAVRFPLGLGRQGTAAGTPTLGSAIVRAFAGHRGVVVVLLVIVVGAVAAWLLSRPSGRIPSGAARNAGLLFLVAVILAPAARAGYVVYPLNLLVWAGALGTARHGTVEPMRPPTALGTT